MVIRPTSPIGSGTGNMVVVLCPTCNLAAWASIGAAGARTTCCGDVVMLEQKKAESPRLVPVPVAIGPAQKPRRRERRSSQGRRGG